MEFSGFRTLRTYQMSWSFCTILTVALAISLPVANFVIKRNKSVPRDVEIILGFLGCFSEFCEDAKIKDIDRLISHRLHEQYAQHVYDENESIANPRLRRKIKIGTVGALICFLLASVVVLLQLFSLLTGGSAFENLLQNISWGCATPRTQWLMIIGSLCLLIGFLWYVLITRPILNGGTYVFGFWISTILALCTLLLSIFAFRDRAIWDFFYQPIPDAPVLPKKTSMDMDTYQLANYRITMYPAENIFGEDNVAA